MYFVVGASSRWSARFQLSFKYRLFDYDAGFGRDQPWLTGLLLRLHADLALGPRRRVEALLRYQLPAVALLALAAHRRPHLDRRRADRPRARVERPGGHRFPLAQHRLHPARSGAGRPRAWATTSSRPRPTCTLDKSDNPDIAAVPRLRRLARALGLGRQLDHHALGRLGTAHKGSIQVDLARRARDLKIGPVSGYFLRAVFQRLRRIAARLRQAAHRAAALRAGDYSLAIVSVFGPRRAPGVGHRPGTRRTRSMRSAPSLRPPSTPR